MSPTDIQKFALQWSSLALAGVSAIVAAVSAGIAIRTYQKNTRTKEAEFISQLHRSFFVDETYKKIRNALDDDKKSASSKIDRLVSSESGEFTDFLNFFELAAYFESCGTLSAEAVEAMLGYYLNLLEENRLLRDYVKNPHKGFEYLDKLLSKRRKAH
ncbi:hypothetical protein [Granulicella mallensis]|uniref:DUF4760 domain-containing protein n=1 Tax=Granulicella mallensis TaxID=940614 RepID=A0A7W7ZT35_9BACT|nr:hypothetical protein [Granulicella mallensis]MBB5065647.1 hypothetical protein [Granulicella mallensis]